MGQCTHLSLDRLQIVSVGSLRDQTTKKIDQGREENHGTARGSEDEHRPENKVHEQAIINVASFDYN